MTINSSFLYAQKIQNKEKIINRRFFIVFAKYLPVLDFFVAIPSDTN
jgi:hypothetical protein